MSDKKILGREQILAAKKLRTETVNVPEWGEDCAVIVRELRSAESQKFIEANKKKSDADDNAAIVSMAVVNEDGQQVFSSADVTEISQLGVAPIIRIVKAALALSGLTEAQIKDTAKN